MMRHYEIVMLFRCDQLKSRGESVAQRYKKTITDNGGVVHRDESWGKRLLAYPIKKQSHAYYHLLNIECEKETLRHIKEALSFSDLVLRYLIIRCERAITTPSPIAQENSKRIAEAQATALKSNFISTTTHNKTSSEKKSSSPEKAQESAQDSQDADSNISQSPHDNKDKS